LIAGGPDLGDLTMPTIDGGRRPMTKREIAREKRRKANYAKFCAHKPPKKRVKFAKKAAFSFIKMLLGAGLGVGTMLLFQNPAVAGTFLAGLGTWIGSCLQ